MKDDTENIDISCNIKPITLVPRNLINVGENISKIRYHGTGGLHFTITEICYHILFGIVPSYMYIPNHNEPIKIHYADIVTFSLYKGEKLISPNLTAYDYEDSLLKFSQKSSDIFVVCNVHATPENLNDMRLVFDIPDNNPDKDNIQKEVLLKDFIETEPSYHFVFEYKEGQLFKDIFSKGYFFGKLNYITKFGFKASRKGMLGVTGPNFSKLSFIPADQTDEAIEFTAEDVYKQKDYFKFTFMDCRICEIIPLSMSYLKDDE